MQPWALATLSGFLLYLSIPPREFILPVWLALLPLLWASRDGTPKKAFRLGWLAGFLANLGAYSFMYGVITTHSTIPALGGLVLTCIMALQQGFGQALWLGLCRHLHGRAPTWLLYSSLYVAVEFLYPTVFPLHLGNCQHACLWTSQWMDLAGPAGLTFVIVSFNVALWRALEARRFNADTAVGLGLWLAVLIYGPLRVGQVELQMKQAPQRLRVAMVEHDVGMPHTPQEMLEGLNRLQTMAAEVARTSRPDLIVFPETAVRTPPPPHRVQGEAMLRLNPVRRYPISLSYLEPNQPYSPQAGFQVPLLFGAMAEDENRDGPIPGRKARHNAAFLLDAQGNVIGHALKNKLLLVGEYLPGAAYYPWLYSKVLTRASILTPGSQLAVLPFQGKPIGVTICYEDIIPWLSYRLAQSKPQLLINLSNDGWFGKTDEPAGHLALAKARCIELRLYMARSTSTGVSAFIDPLGRVLRQSQQDGPETLLEEVAWMPGGTVFAVIGPYFSWLCVFLSALWLGQSWRASRLSTKASPSISATERRAD